MGKRLCQVKVLSYSKSGAFRIKVLFQIQLEKIDESIRSKFIPLKEDEETRKFLENCYEKSDAILWQLYHSLAIPILKLFMSQTNVNGFLGKFYQSLQLVTQICEQSVVPWNRYYILQINVSLTFKTCSTEAISLCFAVYLSNRIIAFEQVIVDMQI